jgi:glycerol-3-phosphate acyltransferase PlsY
MNILSTLLVIFLAYLLGCFTTGYYLVRLATGQDVRTLASGNAGSRNVGRILGTKGFILTFIGDAGKGLLAVYLVQRMGGGQLLATAALIAVTAGHIWPVQMRFRGGKGFATYAGGMLILYPLVLLLGLALCGLFYPVLRRTTLAGLAALAGTPLLLLTIQLRGEAPLAVPELFLYSLLVLQVLHAHRTNIHEGLQVLMPRRSP